MTKGRKISRLAVVRAVFATELLGLVRDRRALFSALVLPVLLYPVMFVAHGWFLDVSKEYAAYKGNVRNLELRSKTIREHILAKVDSQKAEMAYFSQQLTYTILAVGLGAILFGHFLFGEFPDALSLIGVAIIIASGIYILLREAHLSKSRD